MKEHTYTLGRNHNGDFLLLDNGTPINIVCNVDSPLWQNVDWQQVCVGPGGQAMTIFYWVTGYPGAFEPAHEAVTNAMLLDCNRPGMSAMPNWAPPDGCGWLYNPLNNTWRAAPL